MSTENFGSWNKQAEVDKSKGRPSPSSIVGPHVAVVKLNSDSTRQGRLSVYTPIFSGPEDDPATWVQVINASPYMSQTSYKGNGLNGGNRFDKTIQASGMIVPSPEVGTKVLICFPSGQKNEGVWFACLPERFNTRMSPGLASSENWDALSDTAGPGADHLGMNGASEFKYKDGTYDSVQAVGEFIEPKRKGSKLYYDTPVDIEGQLKPINYFTGRIYKEQGLNTDLIRGHTTSSSSRETPNEVFGISTKGRRKSSVRDSIANRSSVPGVGKIILSTQEKTQLEKEADVRIPGHSFVMDDGELAGDNELIRLRSSSGHQILLHDTKGVVYVGNATGSVWLEFSNDGKIDLYAQDSINMRTKNFNFEADQNMNFHAGGNIGMVADGTMQLDGGTVNVKSTSGSTSIHATANLELKGSGTNLQGTGVVNIKGGSMVKIDAGCVELGNGASGAAAVAALAKSNRSDTTKDTDGFWKSAPAKINTISTRVPTHEPFQSRDIADNTTIVEPKDVNNKTGPVADAELLFARTEEVLATLAAGPEGAKKQVIRPEERITKGTSIKQPTPTGSVGNLSEENTKNLMGIIGQKESNGNYQAENSFGYVGKYQMGMAALEDTGYIKKGTYAEMKAAGYTEGNPGPTVNSMLKNPNIWTGKDGVSSKEAFLTNENAQEAAQENLVNRNYRTLERIGVIDENTTQEEAAGLLMASHLKGPGNVKKWYNGTPVKATDGFGTSIDQYYNLGRSVVV